MSIEFIIAGVKVMIIIEIVIAIIEIVIAIINVINIIVDWLIIKTIISTIKKSNFIMRTTVSNQMKIIVFAMVIIFN